MSTLTYDFEDDTLGQVPSGWSYDIDNGTSYTLTTVDLAASQRFKVDCTGGSVLAGCDDIPTSIEDIVVTDLFTRGTASAIPFWAARAADDGSWWVGYQIRITNTHLQINRIDTGPSLTTLAQVARTTTAGAYYYLKFELSGSTIRAKAWTFGASEPGTWDITTTDSTYSSGYLRIGASGPTYIDDIILTSDEITTVVEVDQNPAGSINITGHNPTVEATRTPIAVSSPGSITITGYNPTVNASEAATRLFFKFKDTSGNVWTREIDRRLPVRTVVYDSVLAPTYFISSTPEMILADATDGDFDIEMVTAVGREGYIYTLKKIDVTSNTVTLIPLSGEEIDEASSFTLYFKDETVDFISDGADWWIK